MLIHDASLQKPYRDFGIMLPISPSRPDKIMEAFSGDFFKGARGKNYPYPGPVFDLAGAQKRLGMDGPVITRADLERVHDRAFVSALFEPYVTGPNLSSLEKEILAAYELIDRDGKPHRYEPEKAVRKLGELLDNTLDQLRGTYLACELALAEGPGFCFFLGGGMHHARYDSGAGFCLLNDIAVSAAKVLADTTPRYRGTPRLVWIVDMDVHKGDGTAELVHFARRRKELVDSSGPRVLTLSIHMDRGWPLDAETLADARMDRAPLIPSDIDIGIGAGEEPRYIPELEKGLAQLESLSGNRRPDLVIVVDGADPYEYDGLASSALLKLTLDECFRRDMLVYRYLGRRNIPSAWILAGGYGERAWEPTANFLRNLRASLTGY
ncbi:MAG: hypothetical protein LBJ31_08405 [Treponema sp.]|jgi:acetoin utilization deacetylase AcuC-like enzyme|nr:hypothetical protein [Treponema sp.]